MATPTRFACSLDGNCEVDEEGNYLTLGECQDQCLPTQLPLDVAYTVLSFIHEEALHLAPSDRVEAVYQLTGVIVPVEDTRRILRALIDTDLDTLADYPILYHWVEENAYPEDWIFALQEAATLAAIREIQRLGYPIEQYTLDKFLAEGSEEDIAAFNGS